MKNAALCLVLVLLASGEALFAQADALQSYRTGRDLESQGRTADANTYYNTAIRLCNEAITANTATADSYTILTWALVRQKKYQEVLSWGETGLRLYANEYRIMETMGEAYFYLDDYRNSLACLRRYVNALPRGDRSATAYFFMGDIYRLEGKFYLADMAYSTALYLENGIALWWYREGLALEGMTAYTRAVAAFQRALALNPNFSEAREGLTRCQRDAGA